MPWKWLRKLNPYYHRAYVREILALRSRRGPYRFLVNSWARTSDLDLISKVMGTQYFVGELKPLALPIDALSPLVVLAPHQDDELIGAGGALLRARDAGTQTHVIYITDGAQKPPKPSADVREAEARAVCSRIGATYHGLGVSNLAPRPTRRDVEHLAATLTEIDPAVIMTPWLLDLPPKHRFVNDILALAFQLASLDRREIWGYQVHNALYPNGFIDITAVADEKAALWEAYASQLAIHRYDHVCRGRDAWNSHVLGSRPEPGYAELFFALPGNEFLSLFESTCLANRKAYYRGDHALESAMADLRTEISQSG